MPFWNACRAFVFVGPLSAALAVAGPVLAAPVKIAVGYVTASDFTPLFVAKEKGFFDKRDLDVDPKRIPIIVNIPSALISGDLQLGVSTMPLLLQAADGGLDLELVSGAARHRKENSKIALMVRSTLKIEKPEDLKGKKIGVAGFNSTMDVFLRKWLKDRNIGANDVTRIEAQFPQMPDLLKAGTLDAVTITDPLRTIAVKNNVGYVFADYVVDVAPDVLMVGYIARGDWAKQNATAIRGFREALDEAARYINANPDETKTIEQKYLGFAAPSPSDWNTAIRANDLDIYLALGKEFGMYRTNLVPAKLIAQ